MMLPKAWSRRCVAGDPDMELHKERCDQCNCDRACCIKHCGVGSPRLKWYNDAEEELEYTPPVVGEPLAASLPSRSLTVPRCFVLRVCETPEVSERSHTSMSRPNETARKVMPACHHLRIVVWSMSLPNVLLYAAKAPFAMATSYGCTLATWCWTP